MGGTEEEGHEGHLDQVKMCRAGIDEAGIDVAGIGGESHEGHEDREEGLL